MTDPTPAEVIAFLNGDGKLDGLWFGRTGQKGSFWWRKYLPLLTPPAADAGEVRTEAGPTADDIERVALAIEQAWDESDELPPIDFTPGEREYLARAALAAAIRKLGS